MNYVSHPKIRAAIHQSEKIDVRGERFMKAKSDKRHIEKHDFQDYLRIHAPLSMSCYIDEVCKKPWIQLANCSFLLYEIPFHPIESYISVNIVNILKISIHFQNYK